VPLPESFAAIAHLCVFYVSTISHREFANYVSEPEPESVWDWVSLLRLIIFEIVTRPLKFLVTWP